MPRDHLIVQIIKHSIGYFQRTHPDLAKGYNTHAAPSETSKALLIMDYNDRFIAFDPATENSTTYSKHKAGWVMQKPDLNSKSNNATIENNKGG